MKEIINQLDKMIVHIKGKYLYAINKNHTLLLRFELQDEYPDMSFATSKWEKDSEFLAVREDHVVFKTNGATVSLPSEGVNLEVEWDKLSKECNKDAFSLEEKTFELVKKYGDLSSFFHLKSGGNVTTVSFYDTSHDKTITSSVRSLFDSSAIGDWLLPTEEFNCLYALGFKTLTSKESDDGDFFYLDGGKNNAIVSSMKVIR
jgi:hypothetical protein